MGITHLPMEGGYNFRDLGGIKNLEGKYVRWGKIYRSDELKNLTDNDLKYLQEIPLLSIIDFRSEQEIKSAPDRVPNTVKKVYQFSITPGNLANINNIQSLSKEELVTLMQELNAMLVTENHIVEQYKKFFEVLHTEQEVPVIFHCTAGKDRTGMASALFLAALGVDEETIYENYLESNILLENKYSPYLQKFPNQEPVS